MEATLSITAEEHVVEATDRHLRDHGRRQVEARDRTRPCVLFRRPTWPVQRSEDYQRGLDAGVCRHGRYHEQGAGRGAVRGRASPHGLQETGGAVDGSGVDQGRYGGGACVG